MHKRFFLLLIWLPILSYGQRKYPPPPTPHSKPFTKADNDCANKANQCLNSHKYKAKQRRNFYPFSIGGSVMLISYESYMPKDTITTHDQIFKLQRGYLFEGIKPTEFVVDFSKVNESKNLTFFAIDSLTDILYNVGYQPITCNIYIEDQGASCYEPHNAILFLDKNGKVTQYLEICFECQRHYNSSRKFKEVEYCDGKYDMLRKFFAKQGVAYGTKKHGLTD